MTLPGYLHGFHITETWTHRDLPIMFGSDETPFRHLVLIGPNGCGKTTTLTRLVRVVESAQGFAPWFHSYTDAEGVGVWLEQTRNNTALREWGVAPLFSGTEEHIRKGTRILVHVPADSRFDGDGVDGPQAMNLPQFREHKKLRDASFVQFLVNKRTDQAYAREEGDDAKADRIQQWFAGLDKNLSALLGKAVTLKFKREPSFSFWLVDQQGRESPFAALPAGWSAVLSVVSKLLIAYEAHDADPVTSDLPAILAIDEPELHLHPGLQWTFLPTLVRMFPKLQMVVATQSPIVAASLEHATVYDLAHEREIPFVYGGPPDEILLRVFGSAIRPAGVRALVDNAEKSVDAERWDEAQGTVGTLAGVVGEDDPDVVRLRSLMALSQAFDAAD